MCACSVIRLRGQISVNVPKYAHLIMESHLSGRAERELFADGGASVRNCGPNAI